MSPSATRNATAHLVLEAEDAAPAAEHEGVVRGENRDHVDALGLELVDLREVWGRVVRVARRLPYIVVSTCVYSMIGMALAHREGAGDGEDEDLLALPRIGGDLGG